MKKKKAIHFVGIKGVGMTPMAVMAKEAGFLVSGSDVGDTFITDEALAKAGITPLVGFSSEHIITPDLVVTTGAHGGFDNIEVKTAKEREITVVSAGEALGLFMEGTFLHRKFSGISVAGTHGKTTTSAMLATVLKSAGLDPSYIIGTSMIQSLGISGHLGKGNYFIAEADEYASEPKYLRTARFLWQKPLGAIFTNIEFDHPDIYPSVEQIRETFLQFARQLPTNGFLVVYGDDPQIQQLRTEYEGKVITYGFTSKNNYIVKRVHVSGEQTFFWVEAFGSSLGEFVLQVAGEHNALNALAVLITCLEIGIPLEKIKKGLKSFRGSKRRLEFIGNLLTGAVVYDDYAHHPTEIKNTLHALRNRFLTKKIVVVFQPHTYSRTKLLFKEFMGVFEYADTVILTDIYASLREENDPAITSLLLMQALSRYHREVKYFGNHTDVIEYIDQKKFGSDTVLVTLGAGDIYKIHSHLKLV